MFRFGDPDFLYLMLLVPVTAIFLAWAYRQKERVLARFGNPELLKKLSKASSPRRHLTRGILMMGVVLLVALALARPQFGTRVETVKREGQDIIVAMDVSLSMLAEDIRPSRLEKAKLEVGELINRLKGDRVGLIVFAGEAFVQCPLTLDYGAAKLFLSAMDPDLIPVPGTALGDAIQKARAAFSKSENKGKVLIIITDGEDHDGEVESALSEAADDGIIIHTIGIGTPEGVPIPVVDERGRSLGFKKDQNGQVVLTKLDESTLSNIAEETGGQYFRVTDRFTELDAIYETISGMDKEELSTRQVTLFDEKFQPVVGLALLFLLLDFVIPETRRVRDEWKGRFE